MSEVVQVNDLKTMLRDFIIAKIKADFPNTDTSDNSPLVDYVYSPWGTIAEQLIDFADSIEQRTNLNNAATMSKEDLNDIGEGNYMTPRSLGEKASGIVTFRFETVSSVENTSIAEGTVVKTKSGLRYMVKENHIFTPSEMNSYINALDLMYDVDIPVEAENIGESYNIDPGLITEIETPFTKHKVSVTNNTAITGGENEESNEDYVLRIVKFYSSRTLETSPGYEQSIKENFPEVSDVYVAGYGDPLMTRDQVESITIDGVTLLNKSIGGKTDIYIRGFNIKSDKVVLTARTNKFPLSPDENLVDSTSIVVTNPRTLQTLNGITTSVNSNNKKVVTVPETYSATTQWIKGDTIDVAYNYDSDEDGTFETAETESFVIQDMESDLLAPLGSVVAIDNKTRVGVSYPIGSGYGNEGVYSIIVEDAVFKGTSREKCKISVTEPTIENGDSIEVTYSYNDTLRNINTFYEKEENRIVTRDLLSKEAPIGYMYTGMDIKLKPGFSGSSVTDSMIMSALSKIYNAMPMGAKIDESDMVNSLYTDATVASILDYIKLPLRGFYKSSDPNTAYADNPSHPAFIQLDSVEYPVSHTVRITYL